MAKFLTPLYKNFKTELKGNKNRKFLLSFFGIMQILNPLLYLEAEILEF